MSRTSPSKRSRRHGTGSSNQDVIDMTRASLCKTAPVMALTRGALPTAPTALSPGPLGRSYGEYTGTGLPTIDTKRPFCPGDVNLLHASRIVSVPKETREATRLTETKSSDRAITGKLHEKLWITGRMSFIRKVLSSYDRDNSGFLSHEQLRGVMERINLGFNEEAKARVIDRLDEQGTGQVAVVRFLEEFESPKPLGEHMCAEQLRQCGLYNNVQTLQPWEERRGGMGTWRHRVQQGAAAAAGGAYEQQRADLFLLSQLSGKVQQHLPKLRLMFRQMDANKRSGDPGKRALVDREQFVSTLQSLRMQVSKPQIERLFDLADQEGHGCINFEDFLQRFESSNELGARQLQPPRGEQATPPRGEQATPPQGTELQQEELAAALRNPLTYELRRRLYAKAGAAQGMFKQLDLDGSGTLAVEELARCCEALVPGMERREVAALAAGSAQGGGGQGRVDYRRFIKALVEGGPANQRMVETEMRRQEAPPLLRSSWAHSPIWDRPVTPRSCAASWSLSSTKDRQGSSVEEDLAVHEAAVAPVMESLECGVRAWTLADPRHTTSAGVGPSSQGAAGRDDVTCEASRLSQSLDLSSLYSDKAGSTASGGAHTQMATRHKKTWYLKHPDTRHLTAADEASSQYISVDETYTRKTDPAFMSYQTEDLQKRLKQHEQARARRCEADQRVLTMTGRAERDAEELDRSRLQVKGEAKQRYEERAVMYEQARQQGQMGGPLFGRLNLYHEQDYAQPLRDCPAPLG